MKKTTILTFIAGGLLLPQLLLAQQISKEVSGHFALSVTKKVYEVASKVALSDPSQLWLAEQYSSQDSIISEMIVKGLNTKEIKRFTDSTNKKIDANFKTVLSDNERSELDKYMETISPQKILIKGRSTEKADMNSQFGMAMKIYKELNLTDNQLDSLLAKAVEFKNKLAYSRANPQSEYFNHGLFESKNMSSILTAKQYDESLYFKNKKQVEIQAKKTWEELTAKGFAKTLNKDTSLQQLKNYYASQQAIHDKFWYIDKQKTAVMQKKYEQEKEPGVLVLLKSLKEQDNMNSQFGMAMKLRKEINLSDKQVDSLFSKAVEYKKRLVINKANPGSEYFNHGLFESKNMSAILTAKQYNDVLYFKNKNQVEIQAKKTWEELTAKGLAKNLDKDTSLQKIKDYYAAQQAIHDKYWYADKKNTIVMQKKYEQEKEPGVLKLLKSMKEENKYKDADMTSLFGSALKLEKELSLSKEQVETLLVKAKEYKVKKDLAKSHPDSGYFNTHSFESSNMITILTNKQYSQLLVIKNKTNAEKNAGYTWHELTEKKLSGSYNKDSTIAVLTGYYLLTSTMVDRYAHDKEMRNIAIKAIDVKMPTALVALKKAKKGVNITGTYAW